jgi:hypothetical protein
MLKAIDGAVETLRIAMTPIPCRASVGAPDGEGEEPHPVVLAETVEVAEPTP